MSNYVDELGWLTPREAKWFYDDDATLTNTEPRIGYAPPVAYRYSQRDGQHRTSVQFDTRWDPEAPCVALGVGQAVAIGWAISGREIPPKSLFPEQ